MSYDQLTKEYLEKEYVIECRTTSDIAKEIGCSDWTISTYLAKYQIPRRVGGKQCKDLTGQTFGKLKVVEKNTQKQSRRGGYWLCECECGEQKTVIASSLLNGTIYHCGKHSPKGKNHGHWKGGLYVPKSYYSSIVLGAKNRGIQCNLNLEDIEQLLIEQNHKCALSGLPISFNDKTASLDRIDNLLGYTSSNIWWVHKDVNKMKWAYTVEQFVNICRNVTKNYEK